MTDTIRAAIALFQEAFTGQDRCLWRGANCIISLDSTHLAKLYFNTDFVAIDFYGVGTFSHFKYSDPTFPDDLIIALRDHLSICKGGLPPDRQLFSLPSTEN